MLNIAIDLNGGDKSPHNIIKGIQLALKLGYVKPEELLAVGTEATVALAKKNKKLNGLSFLCCSERIEMSDNKEQIRKKKDSTIARGVRLLKNTSEGAEAFVSAGNTGAMVLWGTIILGRIKRGLQPAIAVPLPNECGPCLLLDSGAIHNAQAIDLVNCALMGSIYAKEIWGLEQPIIKLLNIGSESGKGNDTLKLADELLKQQNGLNYQGNIEGDRIFTEPVNVIVCPGEIGNNTIKVAEGVMKLIKDKLGFIWKIFSFLYGHHKKTDHEEIGGAILLGVDGIEIIAHGKSQPLAIANAIRRAKMEATADILSKIKTGLTTAN
ncbi:MAG: phosphate--acyl-ACP acyltransferase [Patescibacteria group bacterium]